MLSMTIDRVVQQKLPQMALGLVEAVAVEVRAHDPALRTMLEELIERLRLQYAGKAAADRPQVAATRRAYRVLGDDPTRYRPANEALLRRVLARRAFPHINTIVDINNYVSLESGFALGCYDLDQICGDLLVRVGTAGEEYTPIGKLAVEASNRLVLADDRGIVGSPTADSERTMVTPATEHVLFVIFAFDAPAASVERTLEQSAALLSRFCQATIRGCHVVQVGQR